MTCPQCGTENAADARLCRHCGATLPEGPQPVPPASAACGCIPPVSAHGSGLHGGPCPVPAADTAVPRHAARLPRACCLCRRSPAEGRPPVRRRGVFLLPAVRCPVRRSVAGMARGAEGRACSADGLSRVSSAAAWMEFVLLMVLCLPLHLYLFPFHLPDFARSARAERLYRSAGHLGDQSGVFLREPPLSAGSRLAHPARKAGPWSVQRDARHQCTSCACHGARRILRPFSESLFSGFFPLAFFDGLCRGGGRLFAVLSLLVWAAIRVLLALLLLRLWPLLQKPEK